MPAFLVQIDGYDPVAAAAVTLRASSVNDDRVCHLDGQTWWPVLFRAPPLRYDLVDAGFSGRIDTPSSAMGLAIEPWPDFARYALADARVRLYSGEPGAAWAGWTLRFDGRVTAQPAIAEGRADLAIAVDDRWLDTPLLALYAGTTGAEGAAAQKGQPKPLALGAPRYCPATLIDSVNIVFQISAYGAIEGVETAMERLLPFEASVGNYASYAALVAATIPPGKFATANAVGMTRHGAPLAGKLCYHVKGDKAGPDGWVRLPGSTIRRIALLAGGSGKTHDASLYGLDAARPWNISWLIREQITAREAIQRIAASVNAVAGVTWLGQLFAKELPDLSGAASITLDTSGTTLPMVRKVTQIAIDPPFWRLAIEAERTEEVHAYEELAGLYVDRGDYVATDSYRENHIVQNQGSSWIYINATASTGNAPPSLPTTSNAWWRVFAAGSKTITLASDKQQFTYNSAGALNPASQIVTLTVNRQNNLGTLSWAATAYNAAGTSLGAVTLTTTSSGSTPVTTQTTAYLQSANLPANTALVIVTSTSGAPDNISDSLSVNKVQDGAVGATGAPGSNAAVVTLYQRSASAPSVPGSTLTFTFATNVLSGTLGSWTQAIPAANGQPLWAITAPASGTGATDTIATGEWTAPVVTVQDGAAVLISVDKPGFTYAAGALSPSSQTRTFTATLQGVTGTTSWTALNAAGSTVKTGTGSTFTIDNVEMGSNDFLYVYATVNTIKSPGIYLLRSVTPVTQGTDIGVANGADRVTVLSSNGFATVLGNVVTSAAAGAAWSNDPLPEGAMAVGKITVSTAQVEVGLATYANRDVNAGTHNASYFAVQVTGTTTRWLHNGSFGTDSMGTHTPGDQYAVIYKGSVAIYYRNGVELKRRTAADGVVTGLVLYGRIYCHGAGKVEEYKAGPAGDLTISNQVSIVPPPMPVIAANYQGTIDSAQFPKTLTPSVTRAGVSIRTAATTTYALSNTTSGLTGAISVNNTAGSADKGRVTLTSAMTGAGSTDLTVTVDGVAQAPVRLVIAVERAAPPSGTGTSGGGAGNKTGSDDTLASVNSITYAQISDIITVDKAAGETIRAYAPLDYEYVAASSGNRSLVLKWRAAPTGTTTYTDFGSPVTGSAATWDATEFYGAPGSVACNQTYAPANGIYDVTLWGALSSATGSIHVLSGTASVEVSA